MYKGKFDEALKEITNFEKKGAISGKNQIKTLILKGKIHCYKEQYIQAVRFGELAYNLGEKQGNISYKIDALFLKAHVVFLGKLEEAFEFVILAEEMLRSIPDDSSYDWSKQNADLLFVKSIIYRYKGEINEALELALRWVVLRERDDEKIDISRIYGELCLSYIHKGDPNKALDYALKSLDLRKELNNQVGIAASLSLVGLCRYSKGELEQAFKLCKQSLAVNEISDFTKVETLHLLGAIYRERAEIDRTLSYYIKGE